MLCQFSSCYDLIPKVPSRCRESTTIALLHHLKIKENH